MSGPGFSALELVAIGAFALNYWVVAPMSAVSLVVAVIRRRRGAPVWLFPVAGLNLIVVAPQLASGDLESWLAALLGAQAATAVGVIVWVGRAMRARNAKLPEAPAVARRAPSSG